MLPPPRDLAQTDLSERAKYIAEMKLMVRFSPCSSPTTPYEHHLAMPLVIRFASCASWSRSPLSCSAFSSSKMPRRSTEASRNHAWKKILTYKLALFSFQKPRKPLFILFSCKESERRSSLRRSRPFACAASLELVLERCRNKAFEPVLGA